MFCLAQWAVIIYLGELLPIRSSDQPECATGRRICTPIRSCSRWGLPSQPVSRLLVRSYRTVASLPVTVLPNATLSIGGLHFCGTIPRITPAGRYPAPCPMELGLSSRDSLSALHRRLPSLLPCKKSASLSITHSHHTHNHDLLANVAFSGTNYTHVNGSSSSSATSIFNVGKRDSKSFCTAWRTGRSMAA